MKLATPSQVREADRLTIERGLVPSLQLMENAGQAAARVARRLLDDVASSKTVIVFAGKGNNGGDAFVVARLLCEWGARVRVFLTCDPGGVRGDARVNLDRWLATGNDVVTLAHERAADELDRVTAGADLLVDGLFGTGFRGDVTGVEARVIACIDDSGADVLALDIPSGVDGTTGAVGNLAVRATTTVTFALIKTGLVLEPGRSHAGDVDVVDIGIPESVLDEIGIEAELTDAASMRALLPRRTPDAHKGDAGRVHVVGGSRGMAGAVVLSARAALRSGAGLVTAVVPGGLHDVLQTSVTEAIAFPVAETETGAHTHHSLSAIRERLADADVVAIGPGMGRHPESLVAVRHLVRELEMPVILDADGLFAFAERLETLADATGPRVVTPHPGEAARLLGTTVAEVRADVFAAARRLQETSGATVVLKGGPTLVQSRSGRTTVNATGNAGMATGGSGDVLTGVIAALIGQGMDPDDAARLGVHVHGLAGDLGAGRLTEWGLVAGDLVDLLPEAFYVLDRGESDPEPAGRSS